MLADEILHRIEEKGVEFSACQITEMNLTLTEDVVMIIRIEHLWNCAMLASEFPHMTFHADGTKSDHSYYWPNGLDVTDGEGLSNRFPRETFMTVAMLELDTVLNFVKRML